MEGDEHAFTVLYDRFKLPLYRFLLARFPEREIAMDILQEVFATLWEKRDSIRFKSSFSNYLFTAARNRALDFIAREKVKDRYLQSFSDFTEEDSSRTDDLVRSKDIAGRINQSIASLPTRTREVFKLSREQELSRKEIAHNLGVSEQTVKSHMFQALRALRLKLGSFLF